MNISNQSRFDQALASFDALNQLDPNQEVVAGQTYPKELLYARRMTAMLTRYAAEASETLQLLLDASISSAGKSHEQLTQ